MSQQHPPAPDRAEVWEGQNKIDSAIGAGGAAVWIVKGEVLARAALRGYADCEEAIVAIAALQHGLLALVEAVAGQHGIKPSLVREMVRDVVRALEDGGAEHCARVITQIPEARE